MLQRVAGRALSPGDFFRALPAATRRPLPAALRGFHTRRGPGRLLKLYYEHPQTHFEAWHHPRSGRLEVGLHCEGTPDFNRRALNLLAPRLLEIKASLYRAELEPWDRGWCRLYETLPALNLSDGLVSEAGNLLAAYVTTLKPMLDQIWNDEEVAEPMASP